jgi:hypothetical protein
MSLWPVGASIPKLRKCFIRHRASGAYFGNSGWTENQGEAKDFFDLRDIAEICVRHELKEVDLVFRTNPGVPEVVIPLH